VEIATYVVDEQTKVRFEIEPEHGFAAAGPDKVIGTVQDAVKPVVEAAKTVLERVREVGPDEVEVRFGVKVSGGADWIVAKAAGEGSFEVTLTWIRDEHEASPGER
jgi:Trypsin-co-occurring domain 1